MSDVDDLLARLFPLLPRRRPTCSPLKSRIAHVEDVVHRAQQTPAQALPHAAQAHNYSALIASDCGMADLARELYLRQYAVIRAAAAVGIAAAKLTLQPLINLARLHTRAGNGDAAYHLLHNLFTAVAAHDDTRIDGMAFDTRRLVVDHDHSELVQWLWATLLADGTRALTRAGRWNQARHAADRQHGIGARLLDGRQVAVIAEHSRSAAHALTMIEETIMVKPWEQAVAACLTTAIHVRNSSGAAEHVTAMVHAGQHVTPEEYDGTFRARLGLTVAALALKVPAADQSDLEIVLDRLERLAECTDDAYVARDVLAVAHLVPIAIDTRQLLDERVRHAGLDAGTIPTSLMSRLRHATDASERIIAAETANANSA